MYLESGILAPVNQRDGDSRLITAGCLIFPVLYRGYRLPLDNAIPPNVAVGGGSSFLCFLRGASLSSGNAIPPPNVARIRAGILSFFLTEQKHFPV